MQNQYRTILLVLVILISMAFGMLLQKYQVPSRMLKINEPISTIAKFPFIHPDKKIKLKTRDIELAVDMENFDTEKDTQYTYEYTELDMNKTALILIDVWKEHPNDGWLKRAQKNIKYKVAPLVKLFRKHNMIIIHAAHGREQQIKPLPNEYIVVGDNYDLAELNKSLKNYGITTLLYAGYASNMCITHRPIGILNMYQFGYEIILVRDCTIAFESPETLNGEWTNKAAIYKVELQWGSTTTLDNLQKAFEIR